ISSEPLFTGCPGRSRIALCPSWTYDSAFARGSSRSLITGRAHIPGIALSAVGTVLTIHTVADDHGVGRSDHDRTPSWALLLGRVPNVQLGILPVSSSTPNSHQTHQESCSHCNATDARAVA